VKNVSGKTSTCPLNSVYSELWLAMAISGSGIGAYNAAVDGALNALGASTVLISLTDTASGPPGTLLATPPA
jgi:hypothetical protein